MSHIHVKSSLALDTLCFLEKRLLNDTKWMNEKQIEEIKVINALLPENFGDNIIGMSNICLIVSAYFDGDLCDAFQGRCTGLPLFPGSGSAANPDQ